MSAAAAYPRVMVKAKHRPTEEERDERIHLVLPPEEFIGGVLAAGPHPEEDDEGPAK